MILPAFGRLEIWTIDDYQAKTIAFLKDQQSIYRQAIAHIDNYLANVQKAKVNKTGTTEGTRTVDSNNKSSYPGPRGDAFRTPELLRGTIERMHASRQKEEEKLQLEKELAAEAKAWFNAKQELMSLQKR